MAGYFLMEAFGANGDNHGIGLHTEAGRRRMVVGLGMMMGGGGWGERGKGRDRTL